MSTILIVDDEENVRITLKRGLKNEGHDVLTAKDVETACTLIQEHDCDVVVTDIIMPRATGIDLLRRIQEQSPDIKVVMITGGPSVETAAEAVRKGAFDYIPKPVSKETIRKVVARAVEVKMLSDEKRRLEEENAIYRDQLEELVETRTQAWRESESKYTTLFKNIGDPIFIFDRETSHFLDCNPSAEKRYGYSREEFQSMRSQDLHVEEEEKMVKVKRISREDKNVPGKPRTFIHQTRNGERLDVEILTAETVYEGRPALASIARDISERKRHERELLNVIANTSHLVNTPLTLALGYMDMVTSGMIEMTPKLATKVHLKLEEIRGLLAKGLSGKIALLVHETSDGWTPVSKPRRDEK